MKPKYTIHEITRNVSTDTQMEHLNELTGSAVVHSSLVPEFKHWIVFVRRVFHLSLYLIMSGSHLAHLVYKVASQNSNIYIQKQAETGLIGQIQSTFILFTVFYLP